LAAAAHNQRETSPRAAVPTDTLLQSIVFLFGMTVVQRSLGFGRAVLFCRWLDPEDLGRWDMAFGFLEFAAPVVMLGLPGCFGRYVEYYRARGQLRTYLRRTTLATLGLGAAGIGGIITFRQAVSQFIFGTPEFSDLVITIAFGLGAVITYNYFMSMLTAFRRNRFISGLEFLNTVLFAALSLTLMKVWRTDAPAVIVGFCVANGLVSAVAIGWLVRTWRSLPFESEPLTQHALWSRLLPFAFWVWGSNWLCQAFDLADRYMLIHCGRFEPLEALAQVGNYHSSRVVPLLLVSVAGLLGTILTPYLSHDWEQGKRDAVSHRMNFVIKLLGAGLFAAALGILICRPLLFGIAFKGKFAGGEAMLPLTLTYCIWFGTSRVAQKYLWCTEHVRLATLAWFTGLAVNIALNFYLVPSMGLAGCVLATCAGNLTSLVLLLALNCLSGMRVDIGVWLVALMPLSLPLGILAASATLLAIVLLGVGTPSVLNDEEKNELLAAARRALERIPGMRTGPKASTGNIAAVSVFEPPSPQELTSV
jgi:O-antigen/teichoic acid export membrane protein